MWLLSLKSILLATDLDERSEPALRTAARLAQLAGAKLHLLHVGDVQTAAGEARLKEYFRAAAPDAPDPHTARVVPGTPAEVIVEHAVHLGAEAVILGPHRTAGTPGDMGSTAATVVRTAPCPCLVAATELRLPLERVDVPIDLSEVASGALSVAVSWASALRRPGEKALLTALHVVPDPAPPGAEQLLREEVGRARERAGGAANVEIAELVTTGADPSAVILNRAISASTDLLVMGTRGVDRTTAGLGSVSAAVARATPCPLLLVPPAIWEEHGAARS